MNKSPEHKIFDTLNRFFDKIYVISLERSNERRKLLNDHLNGLDYSYYWGVDGKEYSFEHFVENGLYNSHLSRQLRILNDQPPRDMLVNAIACALSHLNVYRDMLTCGHEKILVLEDDVILADNLNPTLLESGIKELPKDWEFLYLGYLDNSTPKKWNTKLRLNFLNPILHKLGYERYRSEYVQRRCTVEYSDSLNRPGYYYGFHSYAINAKGAKKMLRYQTPITREIDIALAELFRYGFINAFRLKEQLFLQNRKVLPSLIEEDRFKG